MASCLFKNHYWTFCGKAPVQEQSIKTKTKEGQDCDKTKTKAKA